MKPLAEQNLYEILEVPPDAPEDDIVEAWDRVSALCAPDALATYTLMAPDDAALLGRRLEEALTVLLDPVARQRYDESLSHTPAPVGGGAGASASGPEPARRLPPVIRPLPLPPIIPPLRVGAAGAEEAPAPIPLEHLAPPAEAPAAVAHAPAAVAPAEPIPLATPAPLAAAPTPAPVPAPAAAPAETPRPRLAPVAPLAATPAVIVGEGTRFTGDVLRRAREARGITLQQLCERTKITRHHVENVESDRYEQLPAVVYLRGVLMAMAKELRLDGQKVARSYLEAMSAASAATAAAAAPAPARATQR